MYLIVNPMYILPVCKNVASVWQIQVLLFKLAGIIFPNISDPQNIGRILRYRNYGDKGPTLAIAL